MKPEYPEVLLFIDGSWCTGTTTKSRPVISPATGEKIGSVPVAEKADLERAVAAAEKGFVKWRRVAAYDRYKLMRNVATTVRSRADDIARVMTMEQGKPLAEARAETLASADVIEWLAEEARRTYGRIIPARGGTVHQSVIKEPVGVAAAFTPWNFPVSLTARKISAAIAAGCSVVLKGPEEAPASCAALVRAYSEAGLPAGVLNLVFGIPSEISEYLISHPVVRAASFTGSTAVGKQLAALAGQHMKRVTMELGGHAPAIVLDDADLDDAVKILAANKFRNAGQVCIAPSRFLVQESVYAQFVQKFVAVANAIHVGDGLNAETQMGPLANYRRLEAMEAFVADAVGRGATLEMGGERVGNKGFFFTPTVLTHVPVDAAVLNDEPFGPIAPIESFRDLNAAIGEANRLGYGLAAYAYTQSQKAAMAIMHNVEAGMISINHHGLGLPEVPFVGVKQSGIGAEGGVEALEGYLNTKFVTQAIV